MHCTSAFYGNDPIGVGEISISRSTEKYLNNKIQNQNNISDCQRQPLQNAGITLIALIITIILLLILAGVTIHFTIGENGILKNASIAGEKYEEANAKEQLTLELASIQTKTYKETGKKATIEDIKNLINKDKYNVDIEEGSTFAQIEDIEKEYTFTVDEDLTIQDVEKITNKDKSIKIETSATNKTDYTTSTIKAKITLTEEIASIKIGEEEIEIPAKTEENGKNVYEIGKEVDKNGNYKIKVETVSGNTNYKIQQVSNLSEDMEIYTASDLVRFRDRVNKGATFERRTISVMNNIDLSSVCGKNVNGKEANWEPIGYYKTEEDNCYFKGIFNGKYNTISNLYIKVDKDTNYQDDRESFILAGLFGNSNGTIQNLILENVYINIDISKKEKAAYLCQSMGAVVASNIGKIENIGIKSGTITSINTADSVVDGRWQAVGGICGDTEGNICNCYNNANVFVTNSKNKSNSAVGGIVGSLWSARVENCFNSGTINSNDAIGNWAGGIVGSNYTSISTIENSYNYGEVLGQSSNSTSNMIAGIVGRNGGSSSTKGTINNSYCTTTSAEYSYYYKTTSTKYTEGRVEEETLKSYVETLGDAFISDGKKIDKEGNIVDNADSDENIIYINNGYPILIWQVNSNRN